MDPTVSAAKAIIRATSALSPLQSTLQNNLLFVFKVRILFPLKTRLAVQTRHARKVISSKTTFYLIIKKEVGFNVENYMGAIL